VAGQTGQDSAAQAAAQSPAAGTSKTPGASGIRPAAANGKAGDATDKSAKTDSRASGNAGDAKVDSADDAKPAAQPAAATAADSPKSQAPSPNLTVAGLTPAPTQQAATPAAAQALTQHVQVTAQPATNLPQPNLPALGVEIAARSQSGARQFDIRLDPPELGRVEVRLSIDSTGKASAHLSADQPQTLDLLQKDASGLTRALRDAGLNVAQEGLNFSLRQQAGNSQDHGGGRTLSRRGGALSLHAGKSIEATATSAVWRARPDGRLDISV
jgi:flagellar hook-length control protein FliK